MHNRCLSSLREASPRFYGTPHRDVRDYAAHNDGSLAVVRIEVGLPDTKTLNKPLVMTIDNERVPHPRAHRQWQERSRPR